MIKVFKVNNEQYLGKHSFFLVSLHHTGQNKKSRLMQNSS